MTAPHAVQRRTDLPTRRTWLEMVMGLPVSVTVRGENARRPETDRVVQAMFAELRHVDRVFSTYRPDSEISLLRAGALAEELASPDVREVLALCERARDLTGGRFDARLPQPDGSTLLDPSGLVKGWAVERAARCLDAVGGHDWIVNAGGDVLARTAHGPNWQVAIQDPRDPAAIAAVLPLRCGAIATSGTAARGRHIIDPGTGRPAADQLLSATVVGPSLVWADVLATAAFVEGTRALSRLRDLPGYDCVLMLPNGRLVGTPGAAALLQAS